MQQHAWLAFLPPSHAPRLQAHTQTHAPYRFGNVGKMTTHMSHTFLPPPCSHILIQLSHLPHSCAILHHFPLQSCAWGASFSLPCAALILNSQCWTVTPRPLRASRRASRTVTGTLGSNFQSTPCQHTHRTGLLSWLNALHAAAECARTTLRRLLADAAGRSTTRYIRYASWCACGGCGALQSPLPHNGR